MYKPFFRKKNYLFLFLNIFFQGTIASFNYDTSASSVSTSQTHLQHQYYDICIRRTRSKCAVCFSPKITGTGTTAAASYGISAGSAGPAQTASVGSTCTGRVGLKLKPKRIYKRDQTYVI